MRDIKDFYILGLPIDTEIGQCNFIKVKEYPDIAMLLNHLLITKQHIINIYLEYPEKKNILEHIKNISLYQIIKESIDVLPVYKYVFDFLFRDTNVFDRVTEETFDYYRYLILGMNGLKEEIINPNPEIQKWIEKSIRYKASLQDPLYFEDQVSSVVGFNGITYDDVNEMTLYQLAVTFQRIARIKNYDTTMLFKTVSTEKMDVEQWFGHIDLLKEESHGIAKEEFDKKSNGLFH